MCIMLGLLLGGHSYLDVILPEHMGTSAGIVPVDVMYVAAYAVLCMILAACLIMETYMAAIYDHHLWRHCLRRCNRR